MNKLQRTIKTVIKPKSICGIVISAGGIYWAFWDFQFHEFLNSIQEVNYLYLLFATLFLWGSVWLRALRWHWLFRTDTIPTIVSLYRAELMGYFGNNVLPFRLGEILRTYLIGREWNLSKNYVFGTVVLERILDMISLVALALLLVLYYPLTEVVNKYIIWASVLTLLLIIIIFVILHHIKEIRGKHKIIYVLKQLIEGVLSINQRAFLPVTVLSILIWGIYLFDVYLVQCAFGFHLSFPQILMVMVLSSMALSIPSAPGMIGTFHAAVKYTLVDLFGYAPHDGNSFAIFMHAYGYILLTFLGAFYFMKNQFHENALKNVLDTEINRKTNA